MEVPGTESYCLASTFKLGSKIASKLAAYGIVHKTRVTSLGAGLGAGTRRNAMVLNKKAQGLPVPCAQIQEAGQGRGLH